MIHIENEKHFDETISNGVTLIDFYASWCGPCRMLSPIIEEIDDEFKDKIKVAKLDVDECNDVAIRYSVNAIPAILIFKDNEVKKMNVGFLPKEELQTLINDVLSE